MNICHKLHLNGHFTFPFAHLAASSLHIERKMPRPQPACFCEWELGKKSSDFIVGLSIGGRVRAGRFPDRILIHKFNGSDFTDSTVEAVKPPGFLNVSF